MEPMLLCVGVMIIWSSTKGSAYHGISVVAFVFTAYMPLTLWRHQTGYMIGIGRQTKHITVFRNVTVFDAMISRLILEYISVTAAAIIVFSVLYGFGLIQFPYDIGGVFFGWLAMGAFSAGSGILFGALSEMSHIVEKLNGPVQYFILPFSGCFFMVNWLPHSAQEIVLYIPLVNAFEIIRGGYYGPEIETFGSASYVFASALVTAGLGCFLFERVKDHIDA